MPLLAAGALLICALVSAISMTGARTVNTDTWTGELCVTQEEKQHVSCRLLDKDPLTVRLSNRTAAFSLPLELRAAGSKLEGTLTATGSEWVTVSPAETVLSYDDVESATVTLIVEPIASREVNGETVYAPDEISFSVVWENDDADEDDISATFIINNASPTGTTPGEITDIIGWYAKGCDLPLIVNGASSIGYTPEGGEGDNFPPMTRYKTGNMTTVLYDAAHIEIASAGTVFIDLTDTDAEGTINITTDVSIATLPEELMMSFGVKDKTLVVCDGGTSLETPYSWGGVTPELTVERMVIDETDGSVSWETTDKIECDPDDDGVATLFADEAEAGTYKMNIAWKYNGHILFCEEMSFFVRHDSCGQGGYKK